MSVATQQSREALRSYIREEAADIVASRPILAKYVYEMMQFRKSIDDRCGLTRRQAELLTFIREYQDQHGVSPSFDEMKEGIGLASKSGIHRLVSALVERGRISRLPNRARSIVLEDAA